MNSTTNTAYVGRFRKLADEGADRDGFRRELLNLIVAATEAAGGRIWSRDAEGRWLAADEFRFRRSALNEPAAPATSSTNLDAVCRRRQTLYVEGDSTTSVLHPLEAAGDFVVELTFADAGPGDRRRIGEVLAVARATAERRSQLDEQRRLEDRLQLAEQLRSLSSDLLACEDAKAVAYTLANDARALVGADRVGIWLRCGRGFRLEAMSGQDVVRERSDLVEAEARVVAESLAEAGISAPAMIRLDLESAGIVSWPSYRERFSVRAMHVAPLAADRCGGAASEVAGAIVAEYLEASPASDDKAGILTEIARDGARALALRTTDRRRPTRFPKRRRWAAALLVFVALAGLMPMPADIACRGVLQPVERRHVFAPSGGVVEKIHVAAGDRVVEGQLLLELKSVELDTEIARLDGEAAACEKRLADIRRIRIADRGVLLGKLKDLESEADELEKKLAGLHRQSAVREEERVRMKIVAPVTGTVSTSDVRELLDGRPVAPGQILLTVCRLDGPWRVELRVPESDGGRLADALAGGVELGVTFSPASDPFVDHEARLRMLPPASRSTTDEGAVLVVEADCRTGEAAYDGGEVTARIHAGSESLGSRMFGGVARVIRHRILFRWL